MALFFKKDEDCYLKQIQNRRYCLFSPTESKQWEICGEIKHCECGMSRNKHKPKLFKQVGHNFLERLELKMKQKVQLIQQCQLLKLQVTVQ